MDRRAFLARTAAVLLAAPLAAEAQPTVKILPAGNVFRIGFLLPDRSSEGVSVQASDAAT